MKNLTNKIIENKIALSFREFKDKKILFRLLNNKRDKTKSFIIYENAKFSNISLLTLFFLINSLFEFNKSRYKFFLFLSR